MHLMAFYLSRVDSKADFGIRFSLHSYEVDHRNNHLCENRSNDIHGISPNQIRRALHTRLVLMIMADFLYDQGLKLRLKGNSNNISIREYCFNNYQRENKDEFYKSTTIP